MYAAKGCCVKAPTEYGPPTVGSPQVRILVHLPIFLTHKTMYNRDYALVWAQGAALAIALVFGLCVMYKSRDTGRIWKAEVVTSYRWKDYDPDDITRKTTYEFKFKARKDVQDVEVRVFSCNGDSNSGEYYIHGEVVGRNEDGKVVLKEGIEEMLFRAPGMVPVDIGFESSAELVN